MEGMTIYLGFALFFDSLKTITCNRMMAHTTDSLALALGKVEVGGWAQLSEGARAPFVSYANSRRLLLGIYWRG